MPETPMPPVKRIALYIEDYSGNVYLIETKGFIKDTSLDMKPVLDQRPIWDMNPRIYQPEVKGIDMTLNAEIVGGGKDGVFYTLTTKAKWPTNLGVTIVNSDD